MKNKKIINFFLFSALSLLFIFFLLLLAQNYQCQNCKVGEDKNIKQVCFQTHCFEVEIADSDFERTLGLMYRKELEQNKGMLFVFEEEGIYPFWMKDTIIPLDIVWFNQEKNAVFIEKNAQPCSEIICLVIEPDQQAKYVLEINGGLAEKINLNLGDQIILK